MNNPIKTFQPNLVGRDFVIGDLHGAYAVFENLLKNINFDTKVDRMFSVGDLIDRGPDSLKCLELIEEPWFHSVLSNHEKMMIDFFDGEPSGWFWNQNGGWWARDAQVAHLENIPSILQTDTVKRTLYLKEAARKLPFLITVNLVNGEKVHIIHAEFPRIKAVEGFKGVEYITDAMLADPQIVKNIALHESLDGECLLWSRSIFSGLYRRKVTRDELIELYRHDTQRDAIFNGELSHVISGHTPLIKPITYVNQTNIDTNVIASLTNPSSDLEINPAGLTCLELNTWKFYLAKTDSFMEIEEILVKKSDFDN